MKWLEMCLSLLIKAHLSWWQQGVIYTITLSCLCGSTNSQKRQQTRCIYHYISTGSSKPVVCVNYWMLVCNKVKSKRAGLEINNKRTTTHCWAVFIVLWYWSLYCVCVLKLFLCHSPNWGRPINHPRLLLCETQFLLNLSISNWSKPVIILGSVS